MPHAVRKFTKRRTGSSEEAQQSPSKKLRKGSAKTAPAPDRHPQNAGSQGNKSNRKRKTPSDTKRKGRASKSNAGTTSSSGGSIPGEKPAELAKHTDFYLVKDEPSDYSIDALAAEEQQSAEWDGVRNYQARNVMREMRVGNKVLFYRSGTKDPGVVGLCEVVKDPYADHTSWDPTSKYYDKKCSPEDDPPRWSMVDIKLVRRFRRTITLQEMKREKEEALKGLALLHISRLSVMPLTKAHFEFICDREHVE